MKSQLEVAVSFLKSIPRGRRATDPKKVSQLEVMRRLYKRTKGIKRTEAIAAARLTGHSPYVAGKVFYEFNPPAKVLH